ncbi:hypothetical protein C816_03526 [Oscillibacter sp. 1-3]|nr:hypothetical protein C816_03526 [Oscillibacter sp. 1-3]
MSHVSVKQIAKIEKRQMNPSFLILKALAKVLLISLDSLINPDVSPEDEGASQMKMLYCGCPSEMREPLFQNPFPNSLIPPSTKPSVYILPVFISFWQVPPRRSGAQNPEYSVDKLPGVSSIPSLCSLFAYSVWLDFLPTSIAYTVSPLFLSHFSAPYFFEDYFIIFILMIPSNRQKSPLPYTLVQSANCPAAFLQLTDTPCRRTSANAADSPHLPRHFPLYIYTTGILQFSNSV